MGQRDLRQVTVDGGEVLADVIRLAQDALDGHPFISRQHLGRQPAPALTTEQVSRRAARQKTRKKAAA